MTTSSTNIDYNAPYARPVRDGNWFHRTETWLDERGKGAWIAATVAGFIFVWPVGAFLLAYMIWSKRDRAARTSEDDDAEVDDKASA